MARLPGRHAPGLAVAAALLLAAAPAGATVARWLSLDEHLALSTDVVRARVGDAVAFPGPDRRPRIETRLEILETVKGTLAPGAVIGVRQLRGAWPDGTFVTVPGDAAFTPGEEVVVFLRHVRGRWFLTSLGQSKYTVVRTPGDDGQVVRDVSGLSFLLPGGPSVVAPPAAEAPVPLQTFVDTLRRLAEVAR